MGIGAKVNLAARLMSKSKGDIFIDEETASSIKCLIPNLAKSEGMKLKGYSEIIYAYILTGLETFTLSMKGSVSSTYVQAGVTKQVMTLLNSVSSASRPQGPVEIKKAHVVRSRSHRSLSTSTTDTTFSGRGTDNKATDHSRRSSDVPIVCTNLTEPICFEGGLHEAVYKQMYRELPSPDIEIPDESMCESTPRERLSVVIPNNTEDESATSSKTIITISSNRWNRNNWRSCTGTHRSVMFFAITVTPVTKDSHIGSGAPKGCRPEKERQCRVSSSAKRETITLYGH